MKAKDDSEKANEGLQMEDACGCHCWGFSMVAVEAELGDEVRDSWGEKSKGNVLTSSSEKTSLSDDE